MRKIGGTPENRWFKVPGLNRLLGVVLVLLKEFDSGRGYAMKKVEKGYTFIEVMIVLIAIGALATMVIPRYFGQTERGVVAEATAMLATIRQAEVAYNLENSAYSTSLTSLDMDTPTSTKFTYTVDSAGATTATRSGGGSSFSSTTIILDINGNWSGTHPYRPT